MWSSLLDYLHELLSRYATHEKQSSAESSLHTHPSRHPSPASVELLHHADGYLRVVKNIWNCCEGRDWARCLTTEAVEGAALPLERVDDIEGGDGLALGVLSVCDCIADDTFEEGLEDTTCLFVDH